jgi:Sulfotransferase domain
MTDPAFHLVIPGLRKAANVFVQRTMERTLGCTFVRFVEREQILPDRFDEFFALQRAVGGEHLLPNAHNLRLLAAHNVTRIAILVRDPRDALVSWWHHLERSDIKAARLGDQSAAGAADTTYYQLGAEDKLRDLIARRFPVFQAWIADWLNVADSSATLKCHINRYEDFATDQRGALRAMLAFFGHDLEPVLPDVDGTRDAGIHVPTHFRRGEVGSYRDEAPPELVRLLDERLDRRLAARMGWA